MAAGVVAILGDGLIARIATALGVNDDFGPLKPAAYSFFTVVGVLAGTAGWAAIRRRHAHPGPLLRRLALTVLGLSFIPDLALLPTAEATLGGVVTLLIMHVWVAAVIVSMLVRVLPLPDERQ